MPTELLLWIGFCVFLIAMLTLDLGVFHKESHVVSFKEAMIWSSVWIGLALIFNGGVFYFAGKEKGLEFLTGYLIEKSLSVGAVEDEKTGKLFTELEEDIEIDKKEVISEIRSLKGKLNKIENILAKK